MINDMWCEWKDLAIKRRIKKIANEALFIEDPWEEKAPEIETPHEKV